MDGLSETPPFIAASNVIDTNALAVVIVTYNSAEVLPGLLDSIPAGLAGISNYAVIIVDNDSHDTSVDLALAHPTRPRVIKTGRNAGYAAGINVATATIGPGANILILNPDIRLMPGSVHLLRDRLSDPSVGIVVPQILEEDGAIAPSVRREPSIKTAWSEALLGGRLAARMAASEIVKDARLYENGAKVQWATGAVLMVAARARQIVGAWDESFFLYSEEVDYMRRVRQCGLSIEYLSTAKATHIGGEYVDNPFLSGLMTTNRILDYSRRHGPVATAVFRLGIIVGSALRAALGPGHRASFHAALAASRSSLEDIPASAQR